MLTVWFRPYRNLHFFNAGVNVKDCVVTWTDDGFVFNDDNLCGKVSDYENAHPKTHLFSLYSAVSMHHLISLTAALPLRASLVQFTQKQQ